MLLLCAKKKVDEFQFYKFDMNRAETDINLEAYFL